MGPQWQRSSGPASPAFIQDSSWSPSPGDSRVPVSPVASWWHPGHGNSAGVQDGCARPVSGDSSPALSPQGMRFRISPESASTRPSALFGDPQDCCLGHASANQPSRSQLEDGAGWGAPKPQHSPSGGWCCSWDGVPPKRRRGCSRVWNLGHGRVWGVGASLGGLMQTPPCTLAPPSNRPSSSASSRRRPSCSTCPSSSR